MALNGEKRSLGIQGKNQLFPEIKNVSRYRTKDAR